MNTDLSKIYDNLTPSQLAVLEFNHIGDNDDLERQRILSAVPYQLRKMPDIEYLKTNHNLSAVADLIGLFYWQAQAHYFMRSFNWLHQQKAIEASQLDDDALAIAYRDISQQINTAAAKLAGTEKAINDFIDRHGLSRSTLQAMTMTSSGFECSKAVEGIEPDSVNYQVVTETLEDLLSL
jgi:hypothetical protein